RSSRCLSQPTTDTIVEDTAMTLGHRRSLPLAALLLAALAAVGLAADNPTKDEWVLFRGNYLQTGVAPAPLPKQLVEQWKFSTNDSIEAAVAVSGGVVYAGSMDEHLYALDLAKGTEKWKYKGGPFKAPPSVRDGVVYVGDADGLFHCI